MKIEIKNNEIPSFNPIVIELTIETREELQALWHRLNISTNSVRREAGEGAIVPADAEYDIWHVIDVIAESRGVPMFKGQQE